MSNLKQAAAALTDMADLLGLTEKSIASVARKFRSSLRGLATIGMTDGSISLSDVRQVVKDGIENAYIEGMIEGGLTADDVTSDDAQMVDELNLTQQDYVKDFTSAVKQAQGDKAAQAAILDRVDLWTTAIEMAGQAGLNSAKSNEMVVFTGDDGDESCPTCRRLKGQRHRRKWFESNGLVPRDPRFRDNFECGGYRCQHTLEPV